MTAPAAVAVAAAPVRSTAARLIRSGLVNRRAAVWLRHLVEMVVAMDVGMAFLEPLIGGLAAAAGYRELHRTSPAVATLLMAFEMALPMAVWMDARGHGRRSIVEMTLATVVPAPALVLLAPGDAMGAYHLAMYGSMVGLMLVRRDEYAGGGHHGRH